MLGRRIIVAVAAAIVVVAGAGAIVFGMSHDSHADTVAERGVRVMPFSLERTTHVFTPRSLGGDQQIVADNPADAVQIRLIREHLRKEAVAFEKGDFGDPAFIHGADMPGLAQLEEGHTRIKVTYRDLPAGAEISYRTNEDALVTAIGRWFDAQLGDHGGHAERGGG